MFVVFLNNKLISCDSILPLIMEASERTGRRGLFVTLDAETFDGIRQNVVLWDGIHRIGSLKLLGRRNKTGLLAWLMHRISILPWMVWLSLRALCAPVHYFHFRQLNYWPLRGLYLLNRSRTVYCESDSFGEPELMARVRDLGYGSTPRHASPAAGAILAFHPRFWAYNAEITHHLPRFLFGPTRPRKSWMTYIRERSALDIAKAFADAKVEPSDRIAVFMLSFFGAINYLEDAGDKGRVMRELFETTLDVLEAEAPNLPVFIKPHVFTDTQVITDALAKRPNLKAVVMYLHPSILGTQAAFFVTNVYSTTQADAHSAGVPTIEFSRYAERALEISCGGSLRPDMIDHFIQDDKQQLALVVKELAKVAIKQPTEEPVDDPAGFFAFLHRQEPPIDRAGQNVAIPNKPLA